MSRAYRVGDFLGYQQSALLKVKKYPIHLYASTVIIGKTIIDTADISG